MAKRRRSGAVAAVPAAATATSSVNSAEAGTDSGDDHSSHSHSPPTGVALGKAASAAAAAAAAAAEDGIKDEDQEGEEEEEKAQPGVDASDGAEEGREGETGEKRKRKRTRTRKKKGASAAGAAGAGGDEDDAGDGDGEEGAAGGGGGGGGKGARTATDTVYVEGIPWTCDEGDVREFFKDCGKITEIRMPRWQDSGRPRGYAHVAFAGTSGARAAFGRDGQYLNGRYLTVQAPQESVTEKARRANRKAEQPRGCRTVFVKNLPYDVDESGVNEALAGCGRIASVRLAMWNHTRKLKGFGYVEFSTERGAETCVRTQQSLSIGGRPIVVDFETGAPKGSFRRQDGAQIKKTSADAGVGKGKAPKFKVHA